MKRIQILLERNKIYHKTCKQNLFDLCVSEMRRSLIKVSGESDSNLLSRELVVVCACKTFCRSWESRRWTWDRNDSRDEFEDYSCMKKVCHKIRTACPSVHETRRVFSDFQMKRMLERKLWNLQDDWSGSWTHISRTSYIDEFVLSNDALLGSER